MHLQGLDTEAPRLVTSSGVRLAGEYEDSLGSLLFFLLQQQRSAGAAGAAPAEQPPPKPGQEAGSSADSAPAPAGSLPKQGGPGQFSRGTVAIRGIKNNLAPRSCPLGYDIMLPTL